MDAKYFNSGGEDFVFVALHEMDEVEQLLISA